MQVLLCFLFLFQTAFYNYQNLLADILVDLIFLLKEVYTFLFLLLIFQFHFLIFLLVLLSNPLGLRQEGAKRLYRQLSTRTNFGLCLFLKDRIRNNRLFSDASIVFTLFVFFHLSKIF